MQIRSDNRYQIIRMTVRLHERLSDANQLQSLSLPTSQWTECQRLRELYQIAIRKGWSTSARRLGSRLEQALRPLETSLTQLTVHWTLARPFVLGSLRELYAELASLFTEFPHVEINLHKKRIAVTTESVVLEDIELGPFRIELNLIGTENLPTYTVMAIEPNRASNDEGVTHPHIRDDCLCEGEGLLPIRNALQQGRYSDFFQIVNQLLHTYNPGSAYIALEDWTGVTCESCGASIDADEQIRCSQTSEVVCRECVMICHECDNNFALEVVESCSQCDEDFCSECLDEGYCRACREQNRVSESEQKTSDSSSNTRLVPSVG